MKPRQELAGRYRLAERLGHGGMGEVWRAFDLELHRDVAVKVLLTQVSEDQAEEMLARFRREGRAGARLNHPRIAAVHDTGAHESQPFLVLELLPGPDLATLLDRHPEGLPVEKALEYGAQAAEGLAAAHEAGVVHRDVKPSNLMLTGDGMLKLCDFGIARLQDATAGLSVPGVGMGTVAYMPPEQLRGEPVTGAADVYALGATLFQLLTGRLLFPADNLPAVIAHHILTPPVPASSLRPAIPEALDTYLLTLLAKDPSARPPAHTIATSLRALPTIRPNRAALLLADAERLARTILNPFYQAEALTKIAEVVRLGNPAGAEVLLADAQRLAHATQPGTVVFTEYEHLRSAQLRELKRVAKVVGAGNPARAVEVFADAEELARTHAYEEAMTLVEIAKVVTVWNPARAAKLLADAERLTRVDDPESQEWVRVRGLIAPLMAEHDPAAAEDLARAITDPAHQAEVLTQIARVVAKHDPAAAEDLVRSIDYPTDQARALTQIAEVVAEHDPAAALRLAHSAVPVARSIDYPPDQATELVRIARVVAKHDPAAAEDLVQRTGHATAGALTQIAEVVAEHDPAAALRLARSAVPMARRIVNPPRRAQALTRIARVMAGHDSSAALRLAFSISPPDRDEALTQIAEVVLARDPALAETLLAAYESSRRQAEAMVEIAQIVGGQNPVKAQTLLAKAERVARRIDDPRSQGEVLGLVAEALAEHTPADAERLARTIPAGSYTRPRALAAVAKTMAKVDPAAAEQLARSLTEPRQPERWLAALTLTYQATALADIANVLLGQHASPL